MLEAAVTGALEANWAGLCLPRRESAACGGGSRAGSVCGSAPELRGVHRGSVSLVADAATVQQRDLASHGHSRRVVGGAVSKATAATLSSVD